MKKIFLSLVVLLLVGANLRAAAVSGRVQVMGRPRWVKVATVVYAEPLDNARVQPGKFSISQRNKTFSPPVLPVPVGSVVDFPNDDKVFHNVFSLSRPGPFDLGLYRSGATKNRTFSTPSIYRIFCNIHPQMTAIVLVLPTSYFTLTNAAGGYSLELPPGRYRLTVWSERSAPSTSDITVAAAPISVAEMRLDESRFVEVSHKNKFGEDYPAMAYDPMIDRKSR